MTFKEAYKTLRKGDKYSWRNKEFPFEHIRTVEKIDNNRIWNTNGFNIIESEGMVIEILGPAKLEDFNWYIIKKGKTITSIIKKI